MKFFLIILSVLITAVSFAQMKITEGQFENGLSYPILNDPYDSMRYERINMNILQGLNDLEESPYCISDYGYVQKGSHLQIQVMCTCMEMDKGELRFFFYNLDTGTAVPYSNLFDMKQRDKALEFIDQKIKDYISANPNKCSEDIKTLGDNPSFDDLNVRMTREGIEIRTPNSDSCENSPIKISYFELKEFLRYKFI